MRFLLAVTVIGSLLAAPALPAEEEVQTGADVDRAETEGKPRFEAQVEVTGPPVVAGNQVDRYGQLVTTVSGRQVEDLNAQDFASALRRVPGVTISRFNPIGSYGGGDGGAVYVRGHGSSRPGAEVTTLVDGIPRFVGIWGHPLLDQLSVDSVGAIRVLRSPQPVLVGSSGFAAVDLVPRHGEEPGVAGRVRGSYGSFSTAVAAAELGGATGEVDWRVTASHRSSDGHRANADGTVDAASGRVGIRLGRDWDLSLLVDATDGWADDPGPVGDAALPVTPRFATSGTFSLATLGHRHLLGEGYLKLYLDDGSIDWLQWDPSLAAPFRTLTDTSNWGAHLRETVRPWAGGELVVGLDRDRWGGDTVERRADGDRGPTSVELTATSPYLMVSHAFGEGITVTPSVGVRYTASDPFGGAWGGQAGVTVDLGSTDLYANSAHAFNLPGAWTAVTYAGWGRGEEWQDLEPETLDHLEVGAVHRWGAGVQLEISLFRDRVENALRFVPPPPPPPLYANVGTYRVAGVELGLEASLGARSALFAGGTWSNPDPDQVPNLPGATAVVGFSQLLPDDVRLNLDLEWSDDRYVDNPRFPGSGREVDAFLLVNGRVAVPLARLLAGAAGELFLAGDNLTGADYEYRPGYPMPGRSVLAGFEAGF